MKILEIKSKVNILYNNNMTELKAIFELYNMLDELKPLVELGGILLAYVDVNDAENINSVYCFTEAEENRIIELAKQIKGVA
jgi:hypothetical protein